MPVTYTIDAAQRFVLATVTGEVSIGDLVAMQRAISADPAFSLDFSSLTDLRSAQPLKATGADMQDLARTAPFGPAARRGVLAASDVNFGLARIFEVWASKLHKDVQVFRDADAAYAWLGVSPPE